MAECQQSDTCNLAASNKLSAWDTARTQYLLDNIHNLDVCSAQYSLYDRLSLVGGSTQVLPNTVGSRVSGPQTL